MSIRFHRRNQWNEGQEGPGFISGLLVLISLVPVLADVPSPAGLLLGDDIFMAGLKDTIAYCSPEDSSSKRGISGSFSYDDYYHAKSMDETKNPSIRTDALVESPRFSVAAYVKRPHWAVSPSWNVHKGFGRSRDAENAYFYSGALNSDKAGISGWLSSNAVAFAGYIGWNFPSIRNDRVPWRTEVPNNLIASNLARKKCDYSLSMSWAAHALLVTAYLQKELLPVVNVSIVNTMNNAHADFNYVGQRHTLGVRTVIRYSAIQASLNAGFSDLLSDSSSSDVTKIPVTVRSRALHGKGEATFPLLALTPRISLSGSIAMPELRGFDGLGGPLFFNLDQTESHSVLASAGVQPFKEWEAGITAELFDFRNSESGRLDPFLFSTMSFFMPDKFKIDSLAFSYSSYGLFGKKRIRPLPRWQCDIMVSCARALLKSFSKTREWDFSNIIPRLDNPQKYVFLDEDYALCIIRLANEFRVGKTTISAALQQAVPISLKSQKNGRIQMSQPEGKVERSLRGGTRLCVGLWYAW
jgi:hypothetical protein